MNIKNIIIKTISVIALATACSFSFANTSELTDNEQMIVLQGLRADHFLDTYETERSELFAKATHWESNGVKYMKFDDVKDEERLNQINEEYQAKYDTLVEKVKASRWFTHIESQPSAGFFTSEIYWRKGIAFILNRAFLLDKKLRKRNTWHTNNNLLKIR